VESIGNYIYGVSGTDVYVNLFIGSKTSLNLPGGKTDLAINTNYPWEGKINIAVTPVKKSKFSVHVRIPGWALGHPVPGGTYQYLNYSGSSYALLVNGKPVAYTIENGYAVINREWKKGDQLEVDFPMEVRRVVARSEVKSDVNRVALERGPLVYCFEHPDNEGQVFNFVLPDNAPVRTEFEAGLLSGVQTITAMVPVLETSADGMDVNTRIKPVKAIPYYSWANRGQGQMQVWIPRKISAVQIGAD
jgi:DUF1680 family protein